jgi:hypothetical protein
MRTICWSLTLGLSLVLTGTVHAQFEPKEKPHGIRLDKEVTQHWRVGVRISAVGGPCAGLRGTIPVPSEWPEQKVRIVNEEISPLVRQVSYRNVSGIRQMLFVIPQLPAGQVVTALVTFEITRSTILAPEHPEQFRIPKEVPVEVRPYLGPSPGIDARQTQIRNKAKEIVEGKEGAWKQIETLYNWVRENVKLQPGDYKGALPALTAKTGSRDDLTALFIALCRAHGVPARTVFVMDGCYAEFYLEEAERKGCWFPCQVAGTREFGSLSEPRPVLQKGDNIKVPEESKPQRFVAEILTGHGRRGAAGGRPQVEFVRDVVPAKR